MQTGMIAAVIPLVISRFKNDWGRDHSWVSKFRPYGGRDWAVVTFGNESKHGGFLKFLWCWSGNPKQMVLQKSVDMIWEERTMIDYAFEVYPTKNDNSRLGDIDSLFGIKTHWSTYLSVYYRFSEKFRYWSTYLYLWSPFFTGITVWPSRRPDYPRDQNECRKYSVNYCKHPNREIIINDLLQIIADKRARVCFTACRFPQFIFPNG